MPINRAQCAHASDLPLKPFPKDMSGYYGANIPYVLTLSNIALNSRHPQPENGLSPKKQHEVQYLAALINSIASQRGIERIMDIGAGQGYLDLSLAFQYGKTVIGVDDDQVQTCGAKRRSDLLETKGFVKRGDVPAGKLFHVNRRVHANETFASLVEQIGKAAGDEGGKSASSDGGNQELFGMGANEASENWLLCGLHACGDLTPAVMKHFLQSEASALVVVGCCYNMLTENKPEAPSLHSAVGFPLSAYMLSRSPIFHLGFAARTLACQATCRWADDEQGADNFRRHHFRALLQYVLSQHGLTDRARANSKASVDQDIIIGRLKPSAFTQGFPFYAKLALSRLKMDAAVEGLTDAVLHAYEDAFREREIEIAIVWTLRSMMGEVFESMLLADRYLYLTEQLGVDGGTVELLPLFEPVLSPRNMALVAVKTG
ncbi:hypothetical protein HDU81_000012 [Chytriomyces hyalinus]|nr:hypothetical protein HDU81_000012 [Chytriomyces hyalinus]